MIPHTTLEAAARVAAHAAQRSAARLDTGAAALPLEEDSASPSEADETSAGPAPAPEAHLTRRELQGSMLGPVRGPMRGNEQSADGSTGMLMRTG